MVQYSPLCNTSVVAYLAYLDSCNGQLFVRDSNVGRASGGGSRGYGGGNFGSDFVRLCVALCDKEREKDGVVGGEFGDLGVVRSFVSRLVDEVRTDEVGDAGFSGDCDGSDRGGVVGGSIYGCDKRGVQSAGEQLSNGEVSLDAEDVGRGKHWRKNKKKKEMKRQKNSCNQENGEIGGVSAKPKDALRLSLEKKWALENELRAAKAARELELLKSEDLGAIKKLRERKVQGATERTMVQIEKAHASLVRSGDVPGVQPGFCQTVVDGEIVESVPGLSDGGSKGCSISPSSTISEREVREMKKELEDLKAELKKEKKKNYRKDEALKVFRGEEVAVSVRFGDVAESAKDAFDDVCGKDTWDATGDLDVDPDTLYVKYEGGEVLGGYDYSY